MARQIPKNVRQVGNVSDSSKIYIEDYVDTFMNQLCEKAQQDMLGAFLVGEKMHDGENDYIYVYGAINIQGMKMRGKDFILDEHMWKNACETCKEYFGNAEILGWFVTGNEVPKEISNNILKLHQKFFPREQSVFVTKSSREKEERLYIYKYKDMMESKGHYIYYEKNVEMQNYMISSRKNHGISPSEVIEDRAAKNFRSIIQEKAEKKEKQTNKRWMYTLSTVMVMVLAAAGIAGMNNYERMKQVQENFTEKIEAPQKEEEIVEAVETMGEPTVIEETLAEIESPSEEQEEIEMVEDGLQMEEVYIVKKGDTLASISQEVYGDAEYVEKICEVNGLEDGNLIFVGQKLLLP